jgi:hypothetical protein
MAFTDDDDLGNLGLPVAAVLRARREEAIARQHEAEEAAERLDRIDARRNHAVLAAQSHAIVNGLPWSPTAPFASWPSSGEWVDAVFSEQERADRRQVFEAMKEAGVVGVIGPPEPAQRSAPVADVAGSSRGAPRPESSPLRQRIGDALASFSHDRGCMCPVCVRHRARRSS